MFSQLISVASCLLSVPVSQKTGLEMTVGNISVPDGVFSYNLLYGLAGLLWTISYVLIIYRGVKDKTYGMPMLVLCSNLVWEFMQSFMGTPIVSVGSAFEMTRQPIFMRVVNAIWFLFDCGILYLLFKYGKGEFQKFHPGAPKWAFVPVAFLFMLLSFLFYAACVYEWGDYNGIFGAYVDNVFISLFYIRMLWRRGNADGQSMWIGLTKFLGTFCTFIFGIAVLRGEWGLTKRVACEMDFFPVMKLCVILIIVFDIVYLVSLYRTMKYKLHLNPWTRKPLTSE